MKMKMLRRPLKREQKGLKSETGVGVLATYTRCFDVLIL